MRQMLVQRPHRSPATLGSLAKIHVERISKHGQCRTSYVLPCKHKTDGCWRCAAHRGQCPVADTYGADVILNAKFGDNATHDIRCIGMCCVNGHPVASYSDAQGLNPHAVGLHKRSIPQRCEAGTMSSRVSSTP